jgi:uncharacterized protein
VALCCGPLRAAHLSIIIDDIGYRQSDEAVLSLPTAITLSVLPHTPLGKEIAHTAHVKGHEIMLHLPMQALNGKEMGKGGIDNGMAKSEVKHRLQSALASVPYVKGVNNHMGSLLTQLEGPMSWVMEDLRQKNLYFVDSRTTRFSKAEKAARDQGVPLLHRALFLDNQLSQTALEAQFRAMMRQARQQDALVVIAHPYPETVDFLKRNLTRLQKAGIQLVPTSVLLHGTLAHKQGLSTGARLK